MSENRGIARFFTYRFRWGYSGISILRHLATVMLYSSVPFKKRQCDLKPVAQNLERSDFGIFTCTIYKMLLTVDGDSPEMLAYSDQYLPTSKRTAHRFGYP